ncbi:von Willebrand factor D and EGF domain-containing protein [Elysia marginata]|uniref:von Willebrand factor D and EGF domain-containing protein n=1 Tax=Elysia marginata TaxID=1093978 RepID=A0AAV4FA18_9GAST|nr:von Willebrand factor D and EGF domain-containing protein [Elysia marginata]
MCEVDSNSDCSSVFISGSNFVYSSKLSCHYQEVQVTEIGLKEVPGAQPQIVRAQLIARDRVRCDLGERSAWKRSLRVSVSNDRQTPNAQYQLFVAYDPICFTCDSTTCVKQTGVCVIGDTCVMPNTSSIYDDCKFCSLSNPTEWTIRTELDRCKDRVNEEDSDRSDDDLPVPLIGAGCALLALLIIVIVGLIVFLHRRDQRKRLERNQRYGQTNPTYMADPPPFYGAPIVHVDVRDDPAGKNLRLDRYQVDA